MPRFHGIRAVLTDIEGTTSSLSFVKDVLFPFSRAALPDFLRERAEDPQVRPWLEQVAAETGEGELKGQIARLLAWIDEDRKHTALKALQGMVWRRGYAEGRFRAHVYPDAATRLGAWRAAGIPLYVYSSGSVEAQKLFFQHSEAGDLTPLFSGHFDTTIGAKTDPRSYRRIAERVGVPPEAILFLSDLEAELDAARAARMQTARLAREVNPLPESAHPVVADFAAIELA